MNAVREWPAILGFDTGATITESVVEKNYRRMAKKYHPDAGGTNEQMVELNEAKRLALEWIAKERRRLEFTSVQVADSQTYQGINAVMAQQQAANQWAYQQWNVAAQAQWVANAMGGWGAQVVDAAQKAEPKPEKIRAKTLWQRLKWW
jgi:DnaJ-class molecular chaperone